MSNIKLMQKIFFRNKFQKYFIIIMSVAFTVAEVYLFIASIDTIKSGYGNSLDYFFSSLGILNYFVVLLIFFSYECFSKINLYKESIQICKKGITSVYKSEVCLFFYYILFLTFISLIFNLVFIFVNKQFDLTIIFHTLLMLFCYFILCCLAAVFIGLLMSFIKKRYVAYILMIFFAVSEIELIETISLYLFDYTGKDFSKLFEFFYLVPHSIDWTPNYLTGLIFDINKISLLLLYITLSFLFVALISSKSKKEKIWKAAICSIVCICLLIGYFMPVSNPKYDLSSSGYTYDAEYYNYNKNHIKEEPVSFNVEKYDMKLSAYFNLKANVKVYIDNKNLDEYKFTLYHKYKVLEVTNQDDKKLDFSQDCDYLIIYSSGKTEYLNIKYYGGSSQYYSSYTGINLPGNFYYYPVAGFHKMFENYYGFICRPLQDDAIFNVEFEYPKTVYCNLNEIEKNKFSGTADSLTILSGYYKTEMIEDTVVYYPYFSKEYSVKELNTHLSSFIKENKNVKKIFFIPMVYSMQYAGIRAYDDYIFTHEKFDIEQQVFESRIDYTKRPFFTLVREYYDPNTEPEFLQHTEENADAEEKKQIAVLKALFASENREEATAEIVEYLTDGKDMRTPSEFLFELGEKYA